jgi:hypothetical protein
MLQWYKHAVINCNLLCSVHHHYMRCKGPEWSDTRKLPQGIPVLHYKCRCVGLSTLGWDTEMDIPRGWLLHVGTRCIFEYCCAKSPHCIIFPHWAQYLLFAVLGFQNRIAAYFQASFKVPSTSGQVLIIYNNT